MTLVLWTACGSKEPAPDTAPPVVADTHVEPDTTPSVDTQDTAVPDVVRLDAAVFVIESVPSELMVYRSTPVRLSIKPNTGELSSDLECRWRMGDGTPDIAGCEVEHVFLGGSADARVAVSLTLGGEEISLTRILPLERLEVSGKLAPAEADALPPAPETSRGFRAVFVSSTATLDASALGLLADSVAALTPLLVIHMGGVADPNDSSSWTAFREGFVERLRSRGITLLVAPSPSDLDGAEVRKPLDARGDPLELIDDQGFPGRYALSFRGVFFAVISGADQEAGSISGLKWLKARLAEAQVYESRVVLSHLPLHPFSASGTRELIGPRFKLYELLHRGRVTALVSAGHPAFFKGRYGALPVLSVGSAASGGTLLGHDHEQPASIAVVDFEDGVPARVFALVPRDGVFQELFDETRLPETVEVYTR